MNWLGSCVPSFQTFAWRICCRTICFGLYLETYIAWGKSKPDLIVATAWFDWFMILIWFDSAQPWWPQVFHTFFELQCVKLQFAVILPNSCFYQKSFSSKFDVIFELLLLLWSDDQGSDDHSAPLFIHETFYSAFFSFVRCVIFRHIYLSVPQLSAVLIISYLYLHNLFYVEM